MTRKQITLTLIIVLSMMVVMLMGCGSKQTVAQAVKSTSEASEAAVDSSTDSMEEALSGDSSLYDDDSASGKTTVYIEAETEKMDANNGYDITSSAEESTSNFSKVEEDEQSSVPEEATEIVSSDEISGIITLRRQQIDDQYFITISSIEPDTGVSYDISRFDVGQIVESQLMTGDYYYVHAGTFSSMRGDLSISANRREWFSGDFTKMADTKIFNSNNEKHIGWLNTQGNFIDITETLGEATKSDFDDPKTIYSVGFLPDDSFVYLNEDTKIFYRADINNLLAGKVEDDIFCKLYLAKTDWFKDYRVSDWIDDRYRVASYRADNHSSCYIVDTEAHEFTEFIPGSSRENWSGVVSPDGSKIAFLSMPQNGNEAPRLYVVPVEGGDPVKVECGDFFTYSQSSSYTKLDNSLLGWY